MQNACPQAGGGRGVGGMSLGPELGGGGAGGGGRIPDPLIFPGEPLVNPGEAVRGTPPPSATGDGSSAWL